MSRFDIDLSNDDLLDERFEDLKQRGEGDAVYVTGTNVEYGIYLESGTRDMPPYPWFAPAVREFRADPETFILKNTDYPDIDAIPTANELVEAIAVGLQQQMEANASALSAGDRSPGTDPEHPKRETGNLVAGINATRIK